MKTIKNLIITVLLMVAHSAFAFEVGGIYYAIDTEHPNSVYVCKSNTYSGRITIPSTVKYGDKTYTVSRIEPSAFAGTSVSYVQIPTSVSVIDNSTFYGCKDLIEVDFSESVEIIGKYAFANSNIRSIRHTKGLRKIGDRAFQKCKYLEYIYIPSTVEVIGSEVFYEATRLTDVHIAESTKPLIADISTSDNDPYLFYSCPITTVYLGRRCQKRTTATTYCNFFSSNRETIKTLFISGIDSFDRDYNSRTDINGFGGALEEIHILNQRPPTIPTGSINTINKSKCKLYVLKGTKSKYETTAEWEKFYNIIEIGESEAWQLDRTTSFMWSDYLKKIKKE